MGYAIFCDWIEECKNGFDKWENESRRVIEETLNDKENLFFTVVAHRLEVLDERGELVKFWEDEIRDHVTPMYNFIYPLETEPTDKDILKVSLETNCCVMHNTKSGDYFLTLTGCGMDLSQDIALSYLWLENWIPFDLLRNVCTQGAFSISKDNFALLREAILEQAKHYKGMMDRTIDDLKNVE